MQQLSPQCNVVRAIVSMLVVLAPLTACADDKSGPTAGALFQDCAECPVMIPIPPGRFDMGVDGGEPDRYEGPVRQVSIEKRFAIGKFEVTNAQFSAFVNATGHRAGDNCRIWDGTRPTNTPGKDWRDPDYGRAPAANEPVVCVTWTDAKAYVAWLSRRTGETYRLPSEAEWEWAARGGAPKARFVWGDDPEAACAYANIFDREGPSLQKRPTIPTKCSDGFAGVSPVGALSPNGFGLHDMIGNVWEWLEDCYAMPYPAMPVDGSAQTEFGCERRVTRGGAWVSSVDRQRAEFRGRDPGDWVHHAFGFRVARDF
jgi:formylglycine-generating enzyme required for sulfatase activity